MTGSFQKCPVGDFPDRTFSMEDFAESTKDCVIQFDIQDLVLLKRIL